MSAIQSKSAYLYREIRRALRSGRYLPGQRIDPATLAAEFQIDMAVSKLVRHYSFSPAASVPGSNYGAEPGPRRLMALEER